MNLVPDWNLLSGCPLDGQTQLFFLTDLYFKKGWSLRRISKELGCCKATVRKKLLEAGIELKKQSRYDYKTLENKTRAMRNRGLSYQVIANAFNLWKISTRTGDGQLHAKTTRELILQV